MPNSFETVIKKKLMTDSLAGISYKKVNNKKTFIVIHNMCGTSSSSLNYWNSGSNGYHTSAHYCVDDKEIWQTLEDQWIGHHCGKPSGPAGQRGCSNDTSIGIEIADTNCDQRKAISYAMELTRYLMQKYNIPIDNVVAHREVSLATDCPLWLWTNYGWNNFKNELKRRIDNNEELKFDPSLLDSNSSSSSPSTDNSNISMPNYDNRDDWTNLKEIKGIALVCMPPYHFYSLKDKDKAWKNTWKYDKKFHYLYDGDWKNGIDKTLIAKSLQDNNKHTYIERALYKNQAEKYILSIGIFLPDNLEDYSEYETILMDEISTILYENNLKTKDLWREFDFNRAPSPFMYLDREQWKKFLNEVDKLIKWRYENYGEPTTPEKDPETSGKDYSDIKEDIGKIGYTNRYCLLRMNPTITSDTIKALDEGVTFKIIDADTRGYYKIEITDETSNNKGLIGWIMADSAKVTEKRRYILRNKAKSNDIPRPEYNASMTHAEYLAWKELTNPKLINEFVARCEPYDKGLSEIINAPITNDDRLSSLTKQDTSINNNSIYYSVTEGSPGDTGHCTKPAAELNIVFKPNEATMVDPIYPDLIVPPNYSPAEHNINQQNPIPLSTIEDNQSIKDLEDFNNEQLTFNYDLLNDKKKESKGHPINYLDPYPYDDKVTELEEHYPKVKIDSIEARLYESNHPGDPLPQPVAKNFALVYDAMLKQSKNIETRLVKLENTLAQTLRSLGRLSSRVNINCVYYGGQSNFNKYKCIRCLCDDRIHDACTVTIDQCLSCTRYEPILGQTYDILDDTGMNGSVYLDNMQMSYMNLDDLKNLNRVEKRSSKYNYANVNKDLNKPDDQIEKWKNKDKQNYINSIKSKITDSKELDKKIKSIKEEDYAFKMNWYEQDLDLQQPDIKPYPLEGIKARYKKTDLGNASDEDTNSNVIDDNTDQDYLKDLTDIDKLNNGQWVDTREEADTTQSNEYSSEDYYFEEFNQSNYSYNSNSSVGGIFGAECRKKIVEKAKEIVELHKAGKAGYSQGTPAGNRTVDDSNRIIGSNSYLSNVFVYDCSSFASCCYKYAGLNSMYNKNTYAQVREIVNNGGKMWLANETGLKNALPGDLIFRSSQNLTEGQMGKYIEPGHVMVYIGDNKIAHASTSNKPVPNQIRIDDVSSVLKSTNFFARPKDLIEADKKAAANNISSGGSEVTGSIITSKGETFNTIYKFPKAVTTAYTDVGGGAGGVVCNPANNNIAAAHNIPYGTIIYIKELDGKAGGGVVKEYGTGKTLKNLGASNNGVFYVGDTGGPYFDFDLNTTAWNTKANTDILVLEWGTNMNFWSFTAAINYYDKRGEWPKYPDAVRAYKKMNGCTINFTKFSKDDANINQNSKWTSIV